MNSVLSQNQPELHYRNYATFSHNKLLHVVKLMSKQTSSDVSVGKQAIVFEKTNKYYYLSMIARYKKKFGKLIFSRRISAAYNRKMILSVPEFGLLFSWIYSRQFKIDKSFSARRGIRMERAPVPFPITLRVPSGIQKRRRVQAALPP